MGIPKVLSSPRLPAVAGEGLPAFSGGYGNFLDQVIGRSSQRKTYELSTFM